MPPRARLFMVRMSSSRTSAAGARLRAVVTDDVPPGVAVSPKGRWASLSADRRNVNWLAPDAIADLAGQSTFHSNLVHVRPATTGAPKTAPERLLTAVAD